MKKQVRVVMIFSVIFLVSLGVFPCMQSNYSEAAEEKTIVLAYVVPQDSMLGTWLSLIYTEAFQRMGWKFVYKYYPAKRASRMADEGEVDGEVARIYTYADTHPNLLRVDESLLPVRFVALGVDPSIQLNGWYSLRGTDYRVDYMRGVKRFEEKLPEVVKWENLSEIADCSLGLKKLVGGRTDLYVDAEMTVARPLKTAEFKDSGIRIVGVMEEVPIYPYLHKKHRELVPELAAVLKAMKEEGLIEQYKAAAEEK